MWRPGGMEIIAILVVVLILFGPKQLPKLGRMFGRTMKNVKDGMEGNFEDDDDEKSTESLAEAKPAEKTEKSETKTTA